MIILEQESEEYSNKFIESGYAYNGFIAGAKSNYVKQQILQAQIVAYQDCLYYIEENHNEKYVHQKIQELQQQLKELET